MNKLFLTFAFLFATLTVVNAFTRGTACENACAAKYADDLHNCYVLYGPNGNHPDEVLLQRCKKTIDGWLTTCLNNCVGE